MKNYNEIVSTYIGIDKIRLQSLITQIELYLADGIREGKYQVDCNLGTLSQHSYYMRRLVLNSLREAGWEFITFIDNDDFIIRITLKDTEK